MKAYLGGFVLALVLAIWLQPAEAGLVWAGAGVKNIHVLAIGSDYSSSRFSINGGADAQALAGAFRAGIGSAHGTAGVVEVVNQRATKAAILLAVDKAAATLEPEDAFVFFFSGHVTVREQQTYLIPHDALLSGTGQPDPGKLISAADLRTALGKVRANYRLLLFDSDYLDMGPVTQGTYVLHASGPGGHAREGGMHGSFTTVLLQALQGWGDADQDGRVSVFELAGFVGRHLPFFSDHPSPQFPVIRLYGPDFPLIRKPRRDPGLAAVALADKLDANLVDLIRLYEAQGIEGVQAYGVEHQLDITDGRVEIIVNAVSTDVLDALKAEVVHLGGTVETEFENVLYATLPVAALEGFVMQEAVWRVDGSRQVFAPPSGTVPAPSR